MDPNDSDLCSHQQPSQVNNPPASLCSSSHRSAKNRIGHALRNSWGRRESDHKGTKKSNSLVNNQYTYMPYLFNVMNVANASYCGCVL